MDDLQWMLYSVSKKDSNKRQPVAFVATHFRILERCIKEHGVPVTMEGRSLLNSLPNHFNLMSTWKDPRL